MARPRVVLPSAAARAFRSGGLLALLLLARSTLGAEGAGPPAIYVEGLSEQAGAYSFFVFWPEAAGEFPDGAKEWWRRVDPAAPEDPGEAGIRIPLPGGRAIGEAGLLAVPNEVAAGAPNGDPAWFRDSPLGVVRVAGSLSVTPLHLSRGPAVLRYRLAKTGQGFTLTLLNPERLARERHPDLEPTHSTRAGTGGEATLVWGGLAATVVAILAVVFWWWRRSANGRGKPGPAADRPRE
jgi:hypothetical protein